MDLRPDAEADLLQRALEGETVSNRGVLELVAVLTAVSAIEAGGLAPRPRFVADLRSRLLEQEPGAGPVAVPVDEPSVVRFRSRPIRYAAAAAVAVVALTGATAVASRQAVPGDLLYPVKRVLDRAAVSVSGPLGSQGLTHLAQAQQRLDEVRSLLERGDASSDDINQALDAARESIRLAHERLLAAYRDGSTEALVELADQLSRLRAELDALEPLLPAGSQAAFQLLRDDVARLERSVLEALAACTGCGDRSERAKTALTTLTSGAPGPTVSRSPAAPTIPPSTRPTTLPTVVPTSRPPTPSGGPVPTATRTTPAGPTITVPVPPSTTVTVPVPPTPTVTVPLPSGPTVTVPPLPTPTVTVPPLPTPTVTPPTL